MIHEIDALFRFLRWYSKALFLDSPYANWTSTVAFIVDNVKEVRKQKWKHCMAVKPTERRSVWKIFSVSYKYKNQISWPDVGFSLDVNLCSEDLQVQEQEWHLGEFLLFIIEDILCPYPEEKNAKFCSRSIPMKFYFRRELREIAI